MLTNFLTTSIDLFILIPLRINSKELNKKIDLINHKDSFKNCVGKINVILNFLQIMNVWVRWADGGATNIVSPQDLQYDWK